MSNNTVQPAIVVFDKDRTEVLGIAPEGTTDITYLSTISEAQVDAGATAGVATNAAGEMIGRSGSNMGKPVGAVTNPVTGGIKVSSGSDVRSLDDEVCPEVVLWGDSAVMYSSRWDAAASAGKMTASNGVGLCNFTAHGTYVGAKVWVVNVLVNSGWYGERTVTGIVDANNFQIAVDSNAVADAWDAKEAGTQPSVIYANRNARDNVTVRALAMAGPRAKIVANLGGNSQTGESMLTHLDADLAAYPNSRLWVCSTCGANDVRVPSPGSVKKGLDNAKACLSRIKAAGKDILYLGWQPNNTNDASKNKVNFQLEDGVTLETGTNGINRAAQRFNREMARWCAARGIPMISKFDAIVDPASTTGYAQANTMRSDGIHEGRRGGWLVAKKVKPWLESRYPVLFDPLPMSLLDRRYDTAGTLVDSNCRQIFRNPMLSAATAGLATNVNLPSAFGMPAVTAGYTTTQRTVATDGDDFGFNQVASWATSGAGSDQAGSVKFLGVAADVPSGTNRVQAGCKVRTSAQTAFIGLRLVLDVTTSNYGVITAESKVLGSGSTDSTALPDTETIDNEWIISPILTMPNDAIITDLNFYVQGFTSTFPGGFTIAAGRPMILCWTE